MGLSAAPTSLHKQGLPPLKVSHIVKGPSIRILLYLYGHGETRHTELLRLMSSRGTLSLSLTDLESERLIKRKLIDTKPIQSMYNLTGKGKAVAKLFSEIEQVTK